MFPKFAYFIISVAKSVNCQVNNTQNIITLFQFNSRILVDCVVGICNNGMFLEFHEFEMKYRAGV